MGTFYYKLFWLIIIGLQNSADANFLQRAFHFYSLLSCHGSCMSVAFEDWKRFYCSSWFYMAPFHPIPCCTILSHPIQPHPTIAWHGFIYRQHPVWISGLSPHSDQLTEIESFYQDYQQKTNLDKFWVLGDLILGLLEEEIPRKQPQIQLFIFYQIIIAWNALSTS